MAVFAQFSHRIHLQLCCVEWTIVDCWISTIYIYLYSPIISLSHIENVTFKKMHARKPKILCILVTV